MVQDIKITPSGAGDKIPQMLFTGSGATAENMELNVRPDSRLSYEGTEGEVFSISNNLQSGTIFAVKDISGLDQISINASGDTYLSPYYGNVRVGATGVIHEDYALDVQGKGLRVGGSGTVLTRASAPTVTTDTLYNVGGSLYFDGSTVGGGSSAGTEAQVQYNDGSSGFAGDAGFTYYKDKAGFQNDRTLVVSGVIIASTGDAAFKNSITIGSGVYQEGDNGYDNIVIGTQAWAKNAHSNIIIGRNAYARADLWGSNTYYNVIIGDGANVRDYHAYSNVVIGRDASVSARGDDNVVIGYGATAKTEHENKSVFIGLSAGYGSDVGTSRVAIGGNSNAHADGAVALGIEARAQGQHAISLGFSAGGNFAGNYNAAYPRYGAINLGAYTHADGPMSIAIGHRVVAPTKHFVLGSGSAQASVMLSGVFGSYLALPNGQQFRQIASAAQTSDLTQWQNSAGVNVASMTPSGVLNVYDIRMSGMSVTLGKLATTSAQNAQGAIAIGYNTDVANGPCIAIGQSASCTTDHAGQPSIAIGVSSSVVNKKAVAIGTNAQASTESVAVGFGANALAGNAGNGNVAVGENANASTGSAVAIGGSTSPLYGGVAVGTSADAGYRGIGVGQAANAGNFAVALGNQAVATDQTWVIASGSAAAAVGISGVFGSYAALPNDQKLAVGGDVPTYTVDALGHDAWVRGTGVIVGASGIVFSDGSTQTQAAAGGSAAGAVHQIQYNDGNGFAGDSQFLFSKANAAFTNDRVMVVSGVIIANSGDAAYANSISIGSGAYVGYNATVYGNDCIAIGTQARTSVGRYSVVIGHSARDLTTHNDGRNICIGANASTDGSSYRNITIGMNAKCGVNAYNSIAIGMGSQVIWGQEAAIAIGHNAGGNGATAANRAIALGSSTIVKAESSIAIGSSALCNNGKGAALGYGSQAGRTHGNGGAISIGGSSYAGDHAVALGYGAKAPDGGFVLASGAALTDVLLSGVMKTHLTMPNGQQFIQMATAAQTTDLMQWQNSAGTNVAAMTPSGVLNVYDIRTSGTDVTLGDGAENTYPSAGTNYSVTIGKNAESKYLRDVVIGVDAEAAGVNTGAVAIGNTAKTNSQRTVAIGNNSEAWEAQATAVGANAEAEGYGSVAIGFSSEAKYSMATAMGNEANANADRAIAIGGTNTADGYGSIAIGSSADANGYGSIALGHRAVSQEQTWVIASGDTAAAVGISGVFGSYVAIPNDQKLAVGSNVPQYAIDVVTHSGVIRASGVKGCISTNPDAATVTFDLNAATTHAVTLGGNRTLAVSNANVGDKFLIRLQQPTSSAGKTVTWFSHIKWAGGTAPTLTATASKADLLGFLAASGDGGSNIWYDGFVVGQNI